MPLVQDRLKTAILNAFQTAEISAIDGDNPQDALANAIAGAVINEVKQMTITIVGTAGPNPIAVTSVTIS